LTRPIFHNVTQGSDEWRELRCGMLTASEMKLIMTPTLKPANNDKSRSHLYELLAQRITGYVEPSYISDDMMRGQGDEVRARQLYAEKYAPVEEVGFVTREVAMGVTIGCSPDGLVGSDGMIECKSRRQKYQVQTALDIGSGIPEEYRLQVQTALLVTDRQWCDFVSYSGGLPMIVRRVYVDTATREAVIKAAEKLESDMRDGERRFSNIVSISGWHPTERVIETEGEIQVSEGANE
jgi:predicted phage-related endonuclease